MSVDPIIARLIRIIAIVVFGSMASGVFAQGGGFTINGRLKIEGGGMDNTRVVVYKDGKKDRLLTSNLSRFSLDLDLNADYVLSFEKDGFVTKKLSFDTHAPGEAITNGFTPFEFAVSLFKQYDDINIVVFNQPVGIIHYVAGVDDFDYDTDYTKSIQSQLAEVLAQVADAQKEEETNAAQAEKAKAEEARAKAKAEADAKKAAEQKATEEARLKREQEAAAAKAQAERQKQEAAATKAQLERAAADARAAEDERKKAEVAAARAQQEKEAEEARKQQEARNAAVAQKEEKRTPPAPVIKEERPARPKPQPRAEVPRTGAPLVEGADERRSINAVESFEPSRMADAITMEDGETRAEVPVSEAEVTRNEELIVEDNQVIRLRRQQDQLFNALDQAQGVQPSVAISKA